VHEALRRTGRRGILALDPREVDNVAPDDLYLDPHTPHAWLFPRMAAVVHHGGAGNTAAALRAGLPAVIMPVQGDQPFWAWTVSALGVGVYGPRWGDPPALGAALEKVLTDTALRARAAALGERIRAEDGVGGAVALIERTLAA
jgi:UDP:flavonoid glycosyltransferase YjiC (YdhE family)